MIEAKKNERANALKEVKRLCKEFGFTATFFITKEFVGENGFCD